MRRANPFYVALAVAVALLPATADAKRRPGTRFDSQYGLHDETASWQLGHGSQLVNGVNVLTQTVCQGGYNHVTRVCSSDYLFVYQIPAGPPNLVLTFSGLSGFKFDSEGFGILLCSGEPRDEMNDKGMLCTQRSAQTLAAVELEYGASSGNLTIYVSQIPDGATLTFFVHEIHSFSDSNGKLAPVLTLGRMQIAPPRLAFGSQEAGTSSPPRTVVATNWASPSPEITTDGPVVDPGFGLAGRCGRVEPGGSCVALASFVPVALSGEVSGALGLSDGTAAGSSSIAMTGHATSHGVTIAPSILSFGSQHLESASEPRTVTITRAASASTGLTISEIAVAANSLTGVADFAIVDDGCTGTLAPGQSCQVALAFAPQFLGALSSLLAITDDASDGVHRVVLNGTANDVRTGTVSTSSLRFARQLATSTSPQQTVHFVASGPGTHIVAVDATAPFSIARENCTAEPSRAICDVEVAFSPPFAGEFDGALTIASDQADETAVIQLEGSGSDFGLALADSSATIARGDTATYSLRVTSENGFSGPILASCRGAPPESSCTVSTPSTFLAASGSLQIDVSVTTTGAAMLSAGGGSGRLPPGGLALVLVVCAGLASTLAWQRARRGRRAHRLAVLACCAAMSCGRAEGTSEPEETPTGTFALELRVASGSVVHVIAASLTVE